MQGRLEEGHYQHKRWIMSSEGMCKDGEDTMCTTRQTKKDDASGKTCEKNLLDFSNLKMGLGWRLSVAKDGR